MPMPMHGEPKNRAAAVIHRKIETLHAINFFNDLHTLLLVI